MKTQVVNVISELHPEAVIEAVSIANTKGRRVIMMRCSEVIREYGSIEVFKFPSEKNLRIDFHIFSDMIVPLMQQLHSKKILKQGKLTDKRNNPAPNENMLVSLDLKLAS